MERDQISTQIRLPAEFHAELSAIAKRDGLSLNSTMLMLIRLGKKLYEGDLALLIRHPDE